MLRKLSLQLWERSATALQNANILLIINPAAGKRKARTGLCDIVEQFCQKGCRVTVHTTLEPGHAARLTAEYADQYDLIVCCGGDGTLSEVVSGLLQTDCRKPLGYIPAGTTNDLAASLHLSRSISKAAQAVLKGESRALDIGRFNHRFFTYIASFGAFTEASYAAPQAAKNTFGHLAYVMEGIKDLSGIRPFSLTVDSDDHRLEGPFVYGSVSNTTSIGGVIKLPSPLVDLGDGRLEVLLVRPPQNPTELGRILQCLQKKRYDGELVYLFQTSSLDIHCPEAFPWSLDGEREEGSDRVEIRCLHHAVTLLVPQKEGNA